MAALCTLLGCYSTTVAYPLAVVFGYYVAILCSTLGPTSFKIRVRRPFCSNSTSGYGFGLEEGVVLLPDDSEFRHYLGNSYLSSSPC